VEANAVIDHVAAKIARFKKPKYVLFMPALPKARDGNIDRGQVQKEHGGNSSSLSTGFVIRNISGGFRS
jgi:acyl-coenzyme A synthetase/AMP-(fatty) acid ligase